MKSDINKKVLNNHHRNPPYHTVICDSKGNIIERNFGFTALPCSFEMPVSQSGRNIKDCFSSDCLPSLISSIDEVNREGVLLGPFELTMIRKEGSSFSAEVWIGPDLCQNKNDQTIVIYVRDLSNQNIAEYLLNIQKNLAVALSETHDLDTGLRYCIEACIKASGMDCGGIYLVDNNSGALNLAYYQGLSSEFISKVSHFDVGSPNNRLVMAGQPIYKNHKELGITLDNEKLKEQLLATSIIPIKYGNRIIGCLNIASHKLENIQSDARDVLETIAALIGGALARLKAEKDLRESEEKVRSVFVSSPDSITIVGLDGQIIDCNPEAAKTAGTGNVSEVIGTHGLKWIAPRDQEKMRQNLKDVIEKGILKNVEYNLITVDGREIPVEAAGSIIRDLDGSPSAIMIISKDVTERKKAEKAIRQNEAKFRMLFEQSGEAIFMADVRGNFLEVNPLVCEQLGYNRDELLRMNIANIIHPDDIKINPIRIPQLAAGEIIISDRRLIKQDGSIIQAELNVRMLDDGTIVGIGRDVTLQRLYEKQLEMQAHMLDAVQQSVVASNQYGLITYFNEFAERLFGWTKSEVVGKHLAEILHIDENESFRKELSDCLLSKNSWTGEITVKDKHSRDIPILATASPIYEGETFIGTINVAFDITERIKIESIQRENEEKYRATFENTGSASAIIEEDTIVSLTNMEFERLLEYSKSEIEGKKSWTEFVVKEDLEKMLAQHRLRRENREQALTKYEFRLVTKSGKIRNILLTIDIIPGTKKSIASLIDITERMKAEEALKLSEDKFAKAFKASPAAISITRLRDGVIVDCNKSTEEMLGYSIEEIIGLTTEKLGIWVDIHDRRRLAEALLAGEPVRDWGVRFKAKDGSFKNVQLAAEIIELNNEPYMLATFIDLTEKKLAEEELLKSKLQYQELFESLLEGVALLDHDGIIRFCNPAFMNIHEAGSMGALIGRNIIDFISDRNSPIINNTRELWEKGINSQIEIDIITLKDNKKSILTSGMPKLDVKGKLVSVIAAVIDVTETKRLKDQEFRAQRLEAAGKIAGQVAHDFNNLLGPAIAYPEMIKSCIPEDNSVASMLNDIEKSATAMAEINQQLLTLSRRGHYIQEVINLNHIVGQAIEQLDYQANAIDIEMDLDPNLMNIKGGFSQILRIISNLISNGLDAMHNKGKMLIRTENYYAEEISSKYGRVPKGEYCKVTITDTGCGISEDILPKIFDAFFTTKTADKKRGSGLGLSVVHAIMEDHRGYIDFRTQVGQGTSFYLYFPLTREMMETHTEENICGGTESILVVDDDSLQREVIHNILKRLGYKALTVESGEKAIEFLKNNRQDLLIIDMVMPEGLDGTETYRKAIEINHSQQALLISGFAETNQVKEALRLGVGAFLKKPLTPKSIAEAVRKELDRSIPAALHTK